MTHKSCAVEGCTEPHHLKDWCRIHYGRYLRHGDPLILKPKGNFRRQSEEDVEWAQVVKRQRDAARKRAYWMTRRAHEDEFDALYRQERPNRESRQQAEGYVLRELCRRYPDEYRSYYLAEMEKERSVSVDS